MATYVDSIGAPPRTLTPEEQNAILKVTGEHVSGFRDHLIISIALGTGLREHEIAALTVGDLLGEGGQLRSVITLTTFKKATPDPAPQQIVIPPRLRSKLTRFLAWKKRRGESLAADAPLFVSKKKNAISTRAMRAMFRKWQERAGIERPHTFHEIRHTAITSVYRQNRDLRVAQRFARHKSVAATQRYAHPSIEDLISAVHDLPC
jgi:integrase/recombinase XerC